MRSVVRACATARGRLCVSYARLWVDPDRRVVESRCSLVECWIPLDPSPRPGPEREPRDSIEPGCARRRARGGTRAECAPADVRDRSYSCRRHGSRDAGGAV